MNAAIVLHDVTKTFGSKVAVRSLDLVVPAGRIYGFIGPNGAGKTTTIRLIMSILFPDSGRVSVLGRDSALEARDRIGYLPEERGLYRKMKVGAFLSYFARLKGVREAGLRERIQSWLDRVELPDVSAKRCDELSKGMQQKVQFLAALLHEPDLLILDEPFSGLDPVNMRLLRDLTLEQRARGATILFSTHVMPQAEQLCDRIVMIHEGTKVLDEDLETLRSRHDSRAIRLEPLDPGTDPARLGTIDGVASVRRTERDFLLSLKDGVDVARVMRAVVDQVPSRRLEIERPTLEEVFLSVVGRGKARPS